MKAKRINTIIAFLLFVISTSLSATSLKAKKKAKVFEKPEEFVCLAVTG